MSKKILQGLFFAIGLAIFVYLVYQLGFDVLVEKVKQIGWWWIPIIGLALIWQFFHTRAWYEVLTFLGYPVAQWQLYKLKMIAEAVNMILPSGNIGGDGVRAHLIRKQVPLNTAIPSVMVDKTLDFLSKMVFNIIGFSLILIFIDMPPVLFWSCTVYLIFIFFYNSLLVWIQVKGISGGLLRLVKKIKPLHQALEKRKEQLSLLDENLNMAYTQGKWKLFIAACSHTIGRLLGVVEIWLVLWLLGESPGFVEVLFLGVVTNVISGAFAIIPGQWGVSEYGQVLAAEILGYTATAGLSLGVIRRIRRLFLTGVGLLVYAWFKQDREVIEENKT